MQKSALKTVQSLCIISATLYVLHTVPDTGIQQQMIINKIDPVPATTPMKLTFRVREKESYV